MFSCAHLSLHAGKIRKNSVVYCFELQAASATIFPVTGGFLKRISGKIFIVSECFYIRKQKFCIQISAKRRLKILKTKSANIDLILIDFQDLEKRYGTLFIIMTSPDPHGLCAVFRIRYILVRIRILGSAPLTNGSNPALFVSDLQDAYSFLKTHLHHSSRMRSHREVTNPSKTRFF
jgi:hypothetical protein